MRIRLTTKIVLLAVVINLLVLAIASYFTIQTESARLAREIRTRSSTIADVVQQTFSDLFTIVLDHQQVLMGLSGELSEVEGVARVEVFSYDKGVLYVTDEAHLESEAEELHVGYLKTILGTGSDFDEREGDQYVRFVPIKDRGNRVVGVVELAFDLEDHGDHAAIALANTLEARIRKTFTAPFERYAATRDHMQRMTESMAGIDGVLFLEVVDRRGLIVSHTHKVNIGTRTTETHARKQGQVYADGMRQEFENKDLGTYNVFVPVIIEKSGDTPVAVIEVVMNLNPMRDRIVELRRSLVATVAALTLAILVLLTLALKKAVLGPIGTLMQTTRSVAAGDLSRKADIVTEDEIGELAASFNTMVASLNKSREELSWLSSFPEQNPNPIVEVDAGGSVHYMNPAARYKFPEIQRMGLMHPLFKGIRQDMKELMHFQGKIVLREVEHEGVFYECSAHSVQGGGRIRLYVQDINDRKAMERALRASEAGLAEAQRIAHIGNWTWTIETGELFWSDEIYRIFGHKAGDFEPSYERFLGSVHSEDRERVKKAVQAAVNDSEPYDMEHRIIRPDGSVRVMRERGVVKYDAANVPLKMVGTVQDITDTKAVELDLKQSHGMLEAISRAQSRFIMEMDQEDIYSELLDSLVSVTESMAGIFGEVRTDDSGEMYVYVLASARHDGDPVAGELMSRMNSHCEQALRSGVHVMHYDAAAHGPVSAFLGLPLYHAGDMVGLIGLANRPGGYTDDHLLMLEPLTMTCANMVQAQRANLERLEAGHIIRIKEEDLANAQRIAQMGSWYWDVRKNEQRWSDEVYRIFGLEPNQIKAGYADFIQFVHLDDRELVMRAVHEALEGRPYSIEHRVVTRGGEERIVHEEGEVSFDGATGEPLRMMGTVQDITERKKAEDERRLLSKAIEENINIIFITDPDANIQYVNETFEQVTGYTKQEAAGMHPRTFSTGETTRQQYRALWETILAGRSWKGKFKNRRKDGTFFWVNCTISPMMNDQGRITNFIAFQEDITDKVLTEERIRFLSDHDKVTGLLNRMRFAEIVGLRLQGGSGGTNSALVLVDIDGFKFVNDRYGHGRGDEYLLHMSELIRGMAGECGHGSASVLGRMSGDQVGLFIEDCDLKAAKALAESIRRAVEVSKITEDAIRATVSVGVVLAPEHGTDAGGLMAKADAAVGRAKELGRNRCHIYSFEDKQIESMKSTSDEKERIITALEEDLFTVWYQPIMDLRDGVVHHYEALARIRLQDGSVVFPNEFIATAERFGLISSIDMAVMRKSITAQAGLARKGRHLYFAMNLSGKNLGDPEILDYIKSVISTTGADPSHLIFEITETAAIYDMKKAINFITTLKSIGCRFALDDFGVGFTSFIYLRELRLDYIKIDGSFIRNLHEHPDDQLLVRAITDMARGMGIYTIAEFVEKGETLELLRDFGVDYAQGYHIGKPAEEIPPPVHKA